MALDDRLALLIKSNTLGEGEPDLGEKLISSFLEMLAEADRIPHKIMFLNTGIFLTTEGSAVKDVLQRIEAAGASVLSCGTCLEYYSRADKLVVGRPTNMRDTVATLMGCRVITI